MVNCELKLIPIDRLMVQDEEEILYPESLRESIFKWGILNPILVRPSIHTKYEVILGAKRVKIARNLGISYVPCCVRILDNEQVEALKENYD